MNDRSQIKPETISNQATNHYRRHGDATFAAEVMRPLLEAEISYKKQVADLRDNHVEYALAEAEGIIGHSAIDADIKATVDNGRNHMLLNETVYRQMAAIEDEKREVENQRPHN